MEKNLFTLINGDSTHLILPRSYKALKEGNLDIIYTIPSRKICFFEKFPMDASGRIIRLVVNYITEQKDSFLEILTLDLEKRTISNVEKGYLCNEVVKKINSSAIYYNEPFNKKTIKSVIYGNEIVPICYSLCGNSITDISVGDSCIDEKSPFEVILHVGSMEKIHVYMKTPTKDNPSFEVYKQVYSELTDRICNIFEDMKVSKDYVSFESFIDFFNRTKIAGEIQEEIMRRENRIKEQAHVLSLRKSNVNK